MKILNKTNEHPNLICIGTNENDVEYYIDVQGNLITVNFKYAESVHPCIQKNTHSFFYFFRHPNFDEFIDVLDFFIKLHKVFGLRYSPYLSQTLSFLGFFIYGTNEEEKQHSRMPELKKQLLD